MDALRHVLAQVNAREAEGVEQVDYLTSEPEGQGL
jgi:hypothetical protein